MAIEENRSCRLVHDALDRVDEFAPCVLTDIAEA